MKVGLAVLMMCMGLQLGAACEVFAERTPSSPPPLSEATEEGSEIDYATQEEPPQYASLVAQSGPAPWERPGPIPFNGGYVQHHPRIYLIFYGSDWDKHTLVKEQILQLYNWLPGSSYQSLLTQYFDFNGYVTGDVAIAGSYVDTRVAYPAKLNNEVIKEEIQYSINTRGWSPNYENQYVVLFPPGPEPSSLWEFACAAHGWSGQFAWVALPWSPEGCQRGLAVGNAMQVSASHEYAEAVTDPIPTENYWGWENENFGGEIADICNTGTPAEQAEVAPGIFAAKVIDDYLWAATGNRCVAQDASPARFEVNTAAPTFPVPHTASLNGFVNAAGWGANYNFALMGASGTRYLPSERDARYGDWYGFSPAPNGFVPQAVSAQATGLKGSTTYEVRLDGNGPITLPTSFENVGALYDIGGGTVSFTTPDWRPIATTEAATSVKGHSAVLHATVNPEGTATTYQFEYGPTTSYGTSVPIPAAGIGAGAAAVAVENSIASLEEATVYHFRVSATNSEGTSFGTDRQFRTPGKPVVRTDAALYANTFEPRLTATVNPNGAPTTYQLEYGPTTSYGTKVPLSPQEVGSDLLDHSVGQYLAGLQRNTTFHYRVFAENEVGSSFGADSTFTTLPPCKGPEAKCVWSTQASVDPPPFTEDELIGVSCASASMCMGVGYNGYQKNSFLERWNGSAWSLVQSVPGRVKAISCAATSACAAVGTGSGGTAQSWMITELSGGWLLSEVAPPLPVGSSQTNLGDVSCISTTCVAVGSYRNSGGVYQPLVERWNGSTWAVQLAPNPSEGSAQSAMLSVSCSATTFCLAVGEAANKPFAERYSSTEGWKILSAPNPSGATSAKLASVSCPTSTLCMAVGASSEKAGAEKTLAESWNGSALSVTSSPNPTEAKGYVNFTGVSCRSSSACTAVGYYASKVDGGVAVELKTLAESWNGGAWTLQATPNPSASQQSGLLDVSCASSTSCVGVGLAAPGTAGETKVTLAETWNGSAWSTQSTFNPAPLTEDELKDVSCLRTTVCFGVGRNRYRKNSFIETWSGGSWQLLQNVAGEIKGISCPLGSSFCAVVGKTDAGTPQSWMISEFQGGWLVLEAAPPNPAGGIEATLNDVSCTQTACSAVGSYRNSEGLFRPLIERWNGSAWSLQEAPNPIEGSAQNAMLGVSCAETVCFAVGYSSEKPGSEKALVENWDGSSWSIGAIPTPADALGYVNLNSISCLSPRACSAGGYYASGLSGGVATEVKPMVVSLTATQWSLQNPAPAAGFKYAGLESISCTSVIACTAVGAKSPVPQGQPIMTLAERYE